MKLFWILSALSVASVQATIIFDADTTNTTLTGNSVGGSSTNGTATSLTGTTNNLTFTSTAGANNNSGFASTDNVNALNGTPITVNDVVTFTFEVLPSSGNITANGIEFGFVGGPTPGFRTDDELLFQIDDNGNTSSIIAPATTGVTGQGDVGVGFNEGSVLDGFIGTLTLDQNGYTFEISGVNTSTGTNQPFTGTFNTPQDFLDSVGDGHLSITGQKTASPNLMLNFGEVSIDVTTIPEPSSFLLLIFAGTTLLIRRSRRTL